MTEKTSEDFKMIEGGESRSRLVGISMLVLSVLLTAAVASLIYMAVVNGHASCQNEPKPVESVDVKATINVKSKDKQIKERVLYSRNKHVAYNYGSDGSFDVEDFGKGLHIMRYNENGICYVIPTGTNHSDDGLGEFLKEYDGKDLEDNEEKTNVNAEILGGEIQDTSFIPEKAHAECKSGYKWMVVAGKDSAVGKSKSRQKRAVCSRYRCYNYWCVRYGYWGICRRCYVWWYTCWG